MLSPPPTSHPFLVHVQNYGGRVPPILLDGCWQSTFTLFFLNLMTVLQLFSNQVVVIPWRLAFTPPRKDSGSTGICSVDSEIRVLEKSSDVSKNVVCRNAGSSSNSRYLRLRLRRYHSWLKKIKKNRGVELLDPLLGWAILRPASDSTRALDPAESHSTRDPIPTPPRSSDEPAPWLSSRGCASPPPPEEILSLIHI